MLAEQWGWKRFEDQRYWLGKLLREDANYTFSERQQRAVARISYMRTPFEGWAGYSVEELLDRARAYVADLGYDDEVFLNEIGNETRLSRSDMGILVGLCRTVDMDLPRFDQRAEEDEEA